MAQGGRRIGAGRPAGSGNKTPPELREIARARSPRAFERVLELIESSDERVALAASKEVLDRAWGKAEARGEVAVVHRFAQDSGRHVEGGLVENQGRSTFIAR
jgi:hypothetical protein